MARLDGKVALVVGGSSGIGKAAALTLAQAGARVVVAARRVTEGSAVVEEILRQGGTARFVETDVTQAPQVTRAVESTVAAFGRLDCAVNVPGTTGQPSTIADCTDDNWTQVLHLNLTAFFWCLRAELRQMRAQGGGGSIVNVSSAIGKRAFRGLGPYGATKRALESLTETAALEVASEGITVNAVAPGSIETEAFLGFTQGDAATQRMMAETYHPMARIGQPDEVARAILYLCSDATFTTGTTLTVDGGWVFRS